jgi:predicted nuclease of predicted toxin-antitoxin system
MKLLFDENLPPRLVRSLADIYPESKHVEECNLDGSPDDDIWKFAKENGFVIATKDSDFEQRSVLHGYPPKVVWIRAGNCSTLAIEAILRNCSVVIHTFHADAVESILVIP